MAKKENNKKVASPKYVILKVDDVGYKTTLTRKFRDRVKYQPKDPKKILAFIPGTIVEVFTKKGKKVTEMDKLLSLEAMKMVNEVVAPMDGVVKKVYVKKGDIVTKNQLLIELE
jgi:biotin carboxyl carrier protein